MARTMPARRATCFRASQLPGIARYAGPQCRSLATGPAHQMVMRVGVGGLPAERAASRGGSRPGTIATQRQHRRRRPVLAARARPACRDSVTNARNASRSSSVSNAPLCSSPIEVSGAHRACRGSADPAAQDYPWPQECGICPASTPAASIHHLLSLMRCGTEVAWLTCQCAYGRTVSPHRDQQPNSNLFELGC
jgi:hypothetical protein